MIYEDFYAQLGKLFYQIAAADGKVAQAEKRVLHDLVRKNWEPLEATKDEYGSDQAGLIIAAFDYEESENETIADLASFEAFYKDNKPGFTTQIKKNILQTSRAIAEAYRSKNHAEQKKLDLLKKIMDH